MSVAIYRSEEGAAEVRQRYQEVLNDWPVPAEQVRVPTREGDTFVLVSGPPDAPPLVLLHGAGANASMWREDITTWAGHFRTYAVDIVGEPGLSAPSRPAVNSPAPARWLDDVVDGLGLTRVSMVAASFGGWLAVDYAVRRPDRVTRLALLCPGGLGKQRTIRVLRALLVRSFGRWGARRSVRALTGLNSPQDAPVLESLMLTFAHFKPRMEPLPLFSDAALRSLTIPVQVTVGDRDAMFDSRGTARRIRQCLPHAEVHMLPGTGHAVLGRTDSVLAFLRS
ncbi:alpha/beta fold hydrolase [Streptomyces sp. NPDC048611]|uniref:alpha/beta fold hydrolase n=1 Tax=Streptomyces sp. NPDC048611 TaxID=3155635 RepID=UPI0034484E54